VLRPPGPKDRTVILVGDVEAEEHHIGFVGASAVAPGAQWALVILVTVRAAAVADLVALGDEQIADRDTDRRIVMFDEDPRAVAGGTPGGGLQIGLATPRDRTPPG